MKVTKSNIIKAVKEATGIEVDLVKMESSYYWRGKESCLFSDSCTYISSFNHPNSSIELFVNNFKRKIAELEKEYDAPITKIMEDIDWDVTFE